MHYFYLKSLLKKFNKRFKNRRSVGDSGGWAPQRGGRRSEMGASAGWAPRRGGRLNRVGASAGSATQQGGRQAY